MMDLLGSDKPRKPTLFRIRADSDDVVSEEELMKE